MMTRNDFDPVRDVKFRGRPISKLDRDELLDALIQALWRLRELEGPGTEPVYAPMQPGLAAHMAGRTA